ncbi:Outer membrane protein TolC [Spirosomataceae bacterium TFI 002]|nr:Outer membrane protein TolC [Spirosomataceae bacterium TFI 002]
MRKINFLIFFGLAINLNALAQPLLSKQEAIGLAMEKNFNIKIAENSIRIAEGNADKDNFGYKPTVNISAGGNYNLDNSKASFQDGREVSLNFAASNSLNSAVNLNYVLFDGYNRKYNLERGQQSVVASQINARLALESVLFQVFNSYYETARIESDYLNLTEILSISKERLERSKVNFEYGKGTSLDVSNAEVDVNTDSIAVLNQKQLLANAKHNLNFVLNNNVLADFRVDTNVVFARTLSKDMLLEELVNENTQILLAKSDIKLSEIDEKLTVTSRLPTVSLNGDYGINLSNNNPASFLSRATSNGLTTNLSVSWNVFDGGRRNIQEQNAKIARLSREFNYDLVYQQAIRDFENAWTTYQNRLEIWNALKQNVITSRLNFQRSEERYRLGQITSTDFRQAQSNLINALTARNRAKFDAKLSEVQVYNIAGKIQDVEY